MQDEKQYETLIMQYKQLKNGAEDIAKLIAEKGSKATYLGDFEKIIEFLEKNLMDGDLLITVGAGNVVEIGESLVAK